MNTVPMRSALDLYRAQVEAAILTRDGSPIFNGSIDHAAVILERMFAHAKQRIWILSHNLHARVYGPQETIEQARLFLAKGSNNVRILLESDDQEDLRDHPFIQAFGHFPNVEVRRIPDKIQNSYPFHMTLMDDDSYRFEKSKEQTVAVGVFGDRKGAKNLETIYGSLWERGMSVVLPSTAPQVEAPA